MYFIEVLKVKGIYELMQMDAAPDGLFR